MLKSAQLGAFQLLNDRSRKPVFSPIFEIVGDLAKNGGQGAVVVSNGLLNAFADLSAKGVRRGVVLHYDCDLVGI